jgi:hypothetical protein
MKHFLISFLFCVLAITKATIASALPLPSPLSWTIPAQMAQMNELERQRLENQMMREQLAMTQQQRAMKEMHNIQQPVTTKHRKYRENHERH